MMSPGCNFLTYLRDPDGCIVQSSVREGHNVFTLYGREWLRNLIVWDTIAGTDVPLEDRRLKRFVYGQGTQPASMAVTWLNNYIAGFDVNARDETTFPTSTVVRIHHTLGTGTLNGYYISETGLQLRAGAGSLENRLAFYKTFEPILKMSGFELETFWELKF